MRVSSPSKCYHLVACLALVLAVLVLLAPKTAFAQTSDYARNAVLSMRESDTSVDSFVNSIVVKVIEESNANDLYPSVTLAQAILESKYGTSGLACAPYYNLFGIKGSWNGQSVQMRTSEQDENGEEYEITASFKKYDSWGDSIEDYVSLLSSKSRYSSCKRSSAGSYEEACLAIGKSGYATSLNYASELLALISKYDLDEYDSVVLEDLENCERGIVLADRLGESVSDIVSGGLAARVDCARVGVVSRWKFGLNF